MILTFKISYSHVEYAHIHVLLVHAHTLTRSPPVTVMTLTFLFVMMCGGNVYLWGANSFLLIGSLLPPPHTQTPRHHARTHTLETRVWEGEAGGGLLFIKETLSTLLPSTDTAITTQYTC